jgi:dTDP-4-dehydrorhamnose 3,5-epimerase
VAEKIIKSIVWLLILKIGKLVGNMEYKFSKVLPEVAIIQPDIFYDFRGEYVETWNKEYYKVFGDIDFKQDDISTSVKHTLRGLHGDSKSWKLITCLFGTIHLVIVDYRPESINYLKWNSILLSNKNKKSVLVPPQFANAP